MRTLFAYVLALAVAFGAYGTVAHAQTSCTSPTTDYCYEELCTGQASEDSAACNAYAKSVVNRDDGGDTSCLSITAANESACCSGNDATDSPMCVAYNNYTNADAAKEAGSGAFTPGSGTAKSGGAQQPGNVPLNIKLQNPLAKGGINDIPSAINKILSIVIRIALPFIIIMFIWSGLMFIFARGNPTKVGTAKNMFLYTIIGTLLILGAWTITNALIGTVNSIIN